MTPHVRHYVRYRVERAEQALRAARRDLAGGDLHEAVSRMYYACFHVVSALLLTEGRTARKHSGIFSLFAVEWVKPGRLPKECGRLLHFLYENRQDADYKDLTRFKRREVEGWLRETEAFIAAVLAQLDMLAPSNGQAKAPKSKASAKQKLDTLHVEKRR